MKRGRGQRVGLTRDLVLDAALALVDREGLQALSMRRLGAELGVEAMTIYHHVPNKSALLDGLVERLLVGSFASFTPDASWQEALRDFARTWLVALRQHPGLVPLVLSRPAVTPANLDVLEGVLHRLQQAGFPLSRGLDIVYAVAGFVVGQAAMPTLDPAGGGQAPLLVESGLQDHPLLAQAARANQSEPVDRFDYALDAMLRGFDTPTTRSSRARPKGRRR